MSFINNNKFKEIREAARSGNETALQILQALTKNSPQGDLDRLIGEYYKVDEPVIDETQVEMPAPEVPAEETPVAEVPVAEDTPEIETQSMEESVPTAVVDITDLLNNELDGLIDENDIEDLTFSQFLENKQRDGLRARKNNEYFKAFDVNGKNNYMEAKKDEYSKKFGDSLHDIDRNFSDIDTSLGKYSQSINDLLDDNIELDMTQADSAYSDIINNNGIVHSWGRYWDEEDTNHVIDDLKELVLKYGKQNVMAALNTLKSDNNNYKDYRHSQIDEEISRYGKSLDNLLK